MKAVICDECKTQVPPTTYGLAPDGWVSVDVRGAYKPTLDYCSFSCAVTGLKFARAQSDLIGRGITQQSAEMAATETALTDTEQAF